jgi:hypothetical protein
VAFEDGMGVSQQIDTGKNGILVPPGPDERASNWRFAGEVAALLREPLRRHALGQTADGSRASARASLRRFDPLLPSLRVGARALLAHAPRFPRSGHHAHRSLGCAPRRDGRRSGRCARPPS